MLTYTGSHPINTNTTKAVQLLGYMVSSPELSSVAGYYTASDKLG